MRREIKFRAWNRIVGRMEMPFTLEQLYNVKRVQFQNLDFLQYTGLSDKNGKEIYEGDILKLIYPHNYVFAGIQMEEKIVKIEFQSGGFWFSGNGVTDCNWHHYNSEDREIIGNKFENPELIK